MSRHEPGAGSSRSPSNTFDSLGEAYQVNGNKDLAIKNYRKAIELDPTNLHAIDMLKKLQ
ncbi:MAG TPA: tetratricopeptide repeat protein [Pyrinomonadaceae bacterium]